MKTKTLLKVMNVLAWIAFIGSMMVAGSITISYLVSIGNPQAAKYLYKDLDLSAYRRQNFTNYTFVVCYKVILYITQAYIAFLMTKLLSTINISRPFSAGAVQLMQKISYAILCFWLVTVVNNTHILILEKTYGLVGTYISGDSIFLAGVVYILAQLFKRGVEIQSENELTV